MSNMETKVRANVSRLLHDATRETVTHRLQDISRLPIGLLNAELSLEADILSRVLYNLDLLTSTLLKGRAA